MLSYALLMAMLYGTENKNLKTLLAIATALSMLKGKSAKRIRRPRSKRARRIMAERLAEREDKRENTFDKIELILPVAAKILETLTTKSRATGNAQRAEVQGSARSTGAKVNINKSGSKKRNNNQFVEGIGREDNVEYEDDITYKDSNSYEKDNSYEKNNSHEKNNSNEENTVPEDTKASQELEELQKEPTSDSVKSIEESESPVETDLPEEKIVDDNEVMYEVKEYKVDPYPIIYSDNDITETIKEIFHGTNVTVTLNNGQTIIGEVIGSYRGILILRNASRINYIRGEAIARFY